MYHTLLFRTTLSVICCCIAILGNAQSSQSNDNGRSCHAHEIHLERMANDPAYRERKREQEARIQRYLSEQTAESRAQLCANNIVVPIVVHYQEASNPDAACLRALAVDQIRILNEDFQATNADLDTWTNGTSASFPGINHGEFCVEFVLATRNHPPGFGLSDGDPAVTINQVGGGADVSGDWANYFNIFVRDIAALGYVTDIGGEGNGDGMTIDNNAFGSGGGCSGFAPGAPYNLGRTLTHELGHYLNLSHIWGGGCGSDDGVADTPNVDAPNYNCPSINTMSCGNRDLHMNYMDYSQDACMYMFTAGQANRMEAHFMTSLGNIVDNADNTIGPAIPKVQFAIASQGVEEGSSNCNTSGTRTIPIEIEISDPPVNAATVTITVSGSATNGEDYTVSPSTITFPAETEASQFVDLTVFEDGYEEGIEDVQLSFVLNANGGNTIVGENTTTTVSIYNDDRAPIPAGTVQLINQNFNAGLGDWTIVNGGSDAETWKLFSANGGLDGSQYIYSDSDVSGNGSTTDEELYSPFFNGLDASTLSLELDQYIRVYNQGGFETFTLEIWDGTAWQELFYHDQNDGDLGDWGSPNSQSIDLTPHASAANQLRFTYKAAYDWFWALDNITVTATYDGAVQLAENEASGFAEYDFGPFETIYCYDRNTGNIMLSLTNNSGHDYGCTRVEIDRGAGGSPGATASAAGESEFLTDKTFRVIPENNNPSGSYDISLYYTDAEITGWANESMQDVSDLQMVKGDGQAGTATSLEVEEVTVTNFGSHKVYTASFNTGFSGFALGGLATALPVELVSIAAFAEENFIEAKWTTSSEQNNRGFEVMRSDDGQRGFTFIGWVAGNGTTNAVSDYRYEDHTALAGKRYFYQLRQLDFDGAESLSPIVSALIEGDATRVAAFPNPVGNRLNVQIASNYTSQYTLRSVDGRVVRQQNLPAGFQQVSVDMNKVAAGLYFLVVENERERIIRKIVKE